MVSFGAAAGDIKNDASALIMIFMHAAASLHDVYTTWLRRAGECMSNNYHDAARHDAPAFSNGPTGLPLIEREATLVAISRLEGPPTFIGG